MPLKSAAGYYMGTVDEEGFPNCRLSSGYAKDKASCKSLKLDRMGAAENLFCNGCGNCFCK